MGVVVKRRLCTAAALAFGLVALGAAAPASANGRVVAVQAVVAENGPDGVRVSVTASAATAPNPFVLNGPDRLVIDIPHAQLASGARLQDRADLVSRIRSGALPDGGLRIVLDLTGPARLARVAPAARLPNGEARLNLTLQAPSAGRRASPPSPPDPVRFAQAGRAPNVQKAAVQKAAAAPRRPSTKPVIVIDAGHGGRDPGAIGRRLGVREKDVTLKAAIMLRDRLRATGAYTVVLTRSDDRFLELEQRLDIARARDADLFISLHADSNPNPEAHGASVYTLSERGVTRARAMADRHDWVIDSHDEDRPAIVSQILFDLTQRETTNRSADFASVLMPRLGQATRLLRNSHRNAGFYVLLSPDVPAVLIELGFLTNRLDEARLSEAARLQRKADAIALAVDDFFRTGSGFAGR